MLQTIAWSLKAVCTVFTKSIFFFVLGKPIYAIQKYKKAAERGFPVPTHAKINTIDVSHKDDKSTLQGNYK